VTNPACGFAQGYIKMENIRVHLIVEGQVQGVWFRDSTRCEALTLGIYGWVKNLPDGTVEVMLEGPGNKVKMLVAWCRQGPRGAIVSNVHEVRAAWQGEFDSFRVVY